MIFFFEYKGELQMKSVFKTGMMVLCFIVLGHSLCLAQNARWTFMVYMDGDNNLEPDAIDDFLELAQYGSDSNINIIVQMDRINEYSDSYGNWKTCKRFRVLQGMDPTADNAISDLGESNMGDPAVLVDFINWAGQNYPADNYALVLWNHGNGWRYGDRTREEPVFKAICTDDTNHGDTLYMKEVQTALNTAATRFDLVGFDACLMGMVEVAYEIKDTGAKVMVGSEELEPGGGWPYNRIMGQLKSNPSWTAAELGTSIVDEYYESYGQDQTQSAIDLSKMDILGAVTTEFANTLRTDWSTDKAAVRQKAQVVMDAIDDAVIREKHGESWRGSKGLAIYFPLTAEYYSHNYNENIIDFPAETTWDEFLDAFVSSMSGSWVETARKLSVVFASIFDTQHVDLYSFCSNLVQLPDDLVSGYTLSETAYGFVDIRSTGARLDISDDSFVYIDPGFVFNFAGVDYTGVSISDNGVIYFENQLMGNYIHDPIPGSSKWGERFIAVYWSDIYLPKGGNLYWKVDGASPSRRLIVQWDDVHHYEGVESVTFQVMLYEGTNHIVCHYRDLDFGASELDYGASATVGIQTSIYSGLLYSYDQAKPADNTAIRFEPVAGECDYILSPTSKTFTQSGGQGTIVVDAAAGCEWTATGDSSWITIDAGSSGTGSGTVEYTVDGNTSTNERIGTITIADKTFTVTQAANCAYTISPASESYDSDGGDGVITVSVSNSTCGWAAVSQNDWIDITSGSAGTGDGTVQYTVDVNPTPNDRTGRIVVAETTVTIHQAPNDIPVATVLQNGVIVKNVSLELGDVLYYRIDVPSDADILMITASSGSGDANIYVKYGDFPARNDFDYSSENNGNNEVVGIDNPVSGDWYILVYAYKAVSSLSIWAAYNTGGCTFSLSPATESFPASGGSGTVSVDTGDECHWTAATDVQWIQLMSSIQGSGGGSVSYSVQANTETSDRTGTVTIGGESHTVDQNGAGAITFTPLQNGIPVTNISGNTDEALYYKIDVPSGQTGLIIETGGGTGDCDVFVKYGASPTLNDYTDAAYSDGNEEYLKLVDPGTGTWYIMLFGYSAFSGLSLTATYSDTICGYTISTDNLSVDQAGGIESIAVTTTLSSCEWNSTTYESWISITNGSGVGDGTVVLEIAAFNESGLRYGFVEIEDEIVQVVQSGQEPPATEILNGQTFITSGDQGEMVYFTIDVPEGQSGLYVQTWNGTGDCDLIVTDNLSAVDPENISYDYGTEEYVLVNKPAPGKWYIILEGYENFSNVLLYAEYFIIPGDVTGDGYVGIQDVIAGLQVLSDYPAAYLNENYGDSGVDVSGNGRVDFEEIVYVLQFLAGL